MQLGFVTTMWGAEWDLPTLIENLKDTGYAGVELQIGQKQKHGVEPTLKEQQRQDVAKRFADANVTLVGLGSLCEFQSPDAKTLQKNIDSAKELVVLAHDLSGGGVTVRPNGLPKDVPVDKTLEQIGRALRELAEFGEGYGMQIRLEVHGDGTSKLENIRRIMQAADHDNARVLWNSNPEDLKGDGLTATFNLVKRYLADTMHFYDLKSDYPWADLFNLLKQAKFEGWTLLEPTSPSTDSLSLMRSTKALWRPMGEESGE